MIGRMMLGVLALAGWATASAAEDSWLSASACLNRDALPRGAAFRAAVVLDIGEGHHVNANPPSLDFQIPTVVAPAPNPAVRWGTVHYPAGEPLAASWAEGKAIRVYSGRAVIQVVGAVAADAPLGPTTLRLKLTYQGCDANTCYRPAERVLDAPARIVEAGAASSPANAQFFGAGAKTPPAPGPPGSAGQPIRFEGETDLAAAFERSITLYLATLFLGGLALNLTPCVFPLIPVTMTVFAQQGESRPARVLPLAILYVLGLAATFTVVGVAAALAGKSLGFVLQQPVGVLAVVIVLAAMMASTFGAFEISLPSGFAGRLGMRGGLPGAAFMGMVMGAVAAPCVGPFLLALITFTATTGSAALGAVSFFVTALGIGLPYVFLATFTGLINRFPRGGGWLIWTKRLMGLSLAGLILYYVDRFVDRAFFWPLVLALFIFAAAYLGALEGWSRRPFTRRFWTVRLATGAAILAAGVGTYLWATTERPEVEWAAWSPGLLEKAAAENKPALLYFGADWCIACKEWHASIFADPAVLAASRSIERIYVDVTNVEDAAKRTFAERYQATNPPAVIVLGRTGEVVAAYRNPPGVRAFVEALTRATAPAGAGG
jgi:thiol:disulfide interchange protein DsbD